VAALEFFGGDVSTLIVAVEGEPDFERDLITCHPAVFDGQAAPKADDDREL
jgi:hypothetical protein